MLDKTLQADIATPAALLPVTGFIHPADEQPFQQAGHLRVYLLQNPAALSTSTGTALERSLVSEAQAVLKLSGSVALSSGTLTDITTAAAGQGVTPATLAPQQNDGAKRTQPNRIMALQIGADLTGYFASYMPVDWQNSGLNGHLHCLIKNSDNTNSYAQSILGEFDAKRLSALIQSACTALKSPLSGSL